MSFTFPPIYSLVLSLLPCLIPPYALRLNRVFGTKRIGWVLFAVFALLAVLQLVRAWQPLGLGLDAGLTLDLLNFLVPVLLLIGLVHIETLFRERLRLEEQEKKLRGGLELQVQERTAALDLANEELQREITMRRQGEEELRKSKEQYRFLFEENPQPMWIYDRSSYRFLAFNAAALRHCGFGRTEFRDLTALDLCPRGEIDAFVADTGKTTPGLPRRGQWRHHRKDGSLVELEVTILDLHYDGCPARLVLANDVGTQRELQRQVLQAQKMQVTTQIAGGVAERFSRLISAIEGDAIALAQESQDEVAAGRLKRLAATAGSASGLTRQLLALVGRHPMQSQALDLNELLESQVGTLTRQCGNKIRLEAFYGDDLPPAAGDPALVLQVLHNLVLNAREAMPTGGTLTLSTAAVVVNEAHARQHEGARAGTFVRLGVSDTGCGMTPEVQDRLFEPFFTTKQAAGASGLGLASVHGLIRQHGGWIEVSSQAGTGTRLVVFFPCAPNATNPKRCASAPTGLLAVPAVT
jgi:two-component system, cell cycle sensor histidine kinase and response regulator CckA